MASIKLGEKPAELRESTGEETWDLLTMKL